MILKIYFYQSRIILYLILEMNWLSCGQIGLFPKKYIWIKIYIFGKCWIIIQLPVPLGYLIL
jgi:hypothetical protein